MLEEVEVLAEGTDEAAGLLSHLLPSADNMLERLGGLGAFRGWFMKDMLGGGGGVAPAPFIGARDGGFEGGDPVGVGAFFRPEAPPGLMVGGVTAPPPM